MYRLFALLLSALFGVAFSQVPEFGQQYRQRIGGAIDELARIVESFDADARREGLTRPQALDHYVRAGDAFLARRGRNMTVTLDRFDRLTAQRVALGEAGGFARLAQIATDIDHDLARRTLADFEPAVPMTQEGLGLGALGLLLGRLAAPLLALFVGRRWWRGKSTPAGSPPTAPG